jgi:CTP synthase
VASQFHPEFRSRPNRPHPLFREFVKAAAVRAGVLPADAPALEKPAIIPDKTSQSA